VTTVVLDSGVIIGALDSADVHHHAVVSALAGLTREDLVVPASVLAEILVRPYARGPELVQRVEYFIADLGARIHPLDAAAANAAARLRAAHPSLRLPDAMTLGTAAALGATVKTPTPTGSVDLKIPAGSHAGSKLRLKGRGIPANPAGDFYVILQVALPAADSDKSKEAYAAMAAAMPFNPRASLGV